MAEEKGLKVDMEVYEEAKRQAQITSQGKGTGIADTINLDVHAITDLQNLGVPLTDDSPKYNYEANEKLDCEYKFAPCEATVVGLRYNKQFVDKVASGQECGVLLNRTNFYAEQGGQIYDTGYMVKIGDDSVELSVSTNRQTDKSGGGLYYF